MKSLWLSVGIAMALWFVMFSPWTASNVNFWIVMSCSSAVLVVLSLLFGHDWLHDIHVTTKNVLIGLLIAVVLWGIFWLGDKLSQLLFDFARPQVTHIYAMGHGTNQTLIALLLVFIIGPAEEIFWRGYVQRTLMHRWNANTGFITTTLIYTMIHIWSFNFMLIMAALVVGVFWGLIYRMWPKCSLFPLILSHALWDCAAFVIFPF